MEFNRETFLALVALLSIGAVTILQCVRPKTVFMCLLLAVFIQGLWVGQTLLVSIIIGSGICLCACARSFSLFDGSQKLTVGHIANIAVITVISGGVSFCIYHQDPDLFAIQSTNEVTDSANTGWVLLFVWVISLPILNLMFRETEK